MRQPARLTRRLSAPALALVLAPLFVHCAEGGLLGVTPKLDIQIELAPAADQAALIVDFSDVVVTNTAKRNLIFTNTGRRSLAIKDVKFEGAAEFSHSTLPTVLAIGDTAKIVVSFSPKEIGDYEGRITFSTEDADRKEVTVRLKGTGADPDVVVCAPPLDVIEDNCEPSGNGSSGRTVDYGTVIEAFTTTRGIKVLAVGGSDVLVSSVSVVSVDAPKCAGKVPSDVFVVEEVESPLRVEAGEDRRINVTFTPPCPGDYSAQLVLETNDPRNPSPKVTLLGTGEQDCVAYSESYTSKVENNNKVDILFVIDDSLSMDVIQQTVKDYANNFVAELTKPGTTVDYHIGVTTTSLDGSGDRGQLLAATAAGYNGLRVVTAQMANPLAGFRALLDRLDTGGSGLEYGFSTVDVALSYGGQVTTGAGTLPGAAFIAQNGQPGFLRTDARLAVIIISDEDDVSTRSDIQNIAQRIRTLAGLPPGFKQGVRDNPDENLSVFAIVDPSPGPSQGCPRPTGWSAGDPPFSQAPSGTPTYHAGIAALGASGQLISLCSDFAQVLTNIGKTIAKASCSFAVQQGQVTIDEDNQLCLQGGTCYAPNEYTYEPPVDGYPFGTITIKEASCPKSETIVTFDYTSCQRTPDNDDDKVPNLIDNCPFIANPDQADENSDGVGDACPSTGGGDRQPSR